MAETQENKRASKYKKGSLGLGGAVAMGTGVMIGAGVFALTGQVAEFAGPLFPAAFSVAAIISAFSAYTYIKVSSRYPSAGGIAMILHKAYGHSVMTGASAMLMAFSMVINESLVAWPDPSKCSEAIVRLGGLQCSGHAATT